MVALNAVVYNELHRLPGLIKEASKWASEIVIVDQKSTDGTTEWLYDHKDILDLNVRMDKHHGYCEPSRKVAWHHTKSEWIGVLDADERMSDEFIADMPRIMQESLGAKLKRSLWLSGEHRFTGDYQYRFFHRDNVFFLDEIHTDPQPKRPKRVESSDYVGIWH